MKILTNMCFLHFVPFGILLDKLTHFLDTLRIKITGVARSDARKCRKVTKNEMNTLQRNCKIENIQIIKNDSTVSNNLCQLV